MANGQLNLIAVRQALASQVTSTRKGVVSTSLRTPAAMVKLVSKELGAVGYKGTAEATVASVQGRQLNIIVWKAVPHLRAVSTDDSGTTKYIKDDLILLCGSGWNPQLILASELPKTPVGTYVRANVLGEKNEAAFEKRVRSSLAQGNKIWDKTVKKSAAAKKRAEKEAKKAEREAAIARGEKPPRKPRKKGAGRKKATAASATPEMTATAEAKAQDAGSRVAKAKGKSKKTATEHVATVATEIAQAQGKDVVTPSDVTAAESVVKGLPADATRAEVKQAAVAAAEVVAEGGSTKEAVQAAREEIGAPAKPAMSEASLLGAMKDSNSELREMLAAKAAAKAAAKKNPRHAKRRSSYHSNRY